MFVCVCVCGGGYSNTIHTYIEWIENVTIRKRERQKASVLHYIKAVNDEAQTALFKDPVRTAQ